jgi:glutathione S-transferase
MYQSVHNTSPAKESSVQLYYSPFACSLASHITAREAGLPLDLEAVALATKRTASGADFLAVSPKGQVPTLRLDDGAILTENAAVLQYLADSVPASGLLPAPGSRERYRVLEWLNYVGTEIHKGCFYAMFSPDAPPEAKAWARGLLDKKLAYVASQLAGKAFVAADRFTIADAYLTWALTLAQKVGADLGAHAALGAYLQKMHARPAVQAAIAAEAAASQPSR